MSRLYLGLAVTVDNVQSGDGASTIVCVHDTSPKGSVSDFAIHQHLSDTPLLLLCFALLGLALSFFFVRETHDHARTEAKMTGVESGRGKNGAQGPSFAQVLVLTSWKNRTLFAASQAGMVNNLNDGVVWGLVPIFLAGAGLSIKEVAIIAALYPGVWGIGQLVTGALSDRLGRKWMIVSGMWLQAIAIGGFVVGQNSQMWIGSAILLGIGTALVYPTLLAAISDVAHPDWRASAVGVYRLWRDSGFAVGGLAAGLLADAFDIPFAIAVVGGLTFISGLVVAAVMRETLPARRSTTSSGSAEEGGKT